MIGSIRPLNRAERLGAATGAMLALLLIPAVTTLGAPTMSDLGRCGGGTDSNVAREDFTLSGASSLWREFPATAQVPGLADDPRPAYVIVFANGYDLRDVAMAQPVDTAKDVDTVVCVIQSDGTVRARSVIC